MRWPISWSIQTAAALVLTVGTAPGQVIFTKVADTKSGAFTSFGTNLSPGSQAPSLSGSVVAFLGNGSVYTAPAGGGVPVNVLAGATLPNGQLLGGVLSQPATDGSRVAFVAADFGGQPGIYTAPVGGGGGPLGRVADTATPVPNGTGNFRSFFNVEPSLSGARVAFTGIPNSTGAPQAGVYTGPAAGGALARVADPNTAVQPNASSPSLSGTVVAFSGSGGGAVGIYTSPAAGGAFATVADNRTAIPNGSGNFFRFGPTPSVSGSTVAFVGFDSANRAGVYTGPVGGGALARVADATTAIPGGSGTFTGFGAVDVSGSVVAFVGSGGAVLSGIYFEDTAGGPLTKLVATGDTLDGRSVSNLFFNDGLDGPDIAFTAAFTDGSQAIFVGHVSAIPEPASWSLTAGAGLLGLLGWRRRGRPQEGARPLGGSM